MHHAHVVGHRNHRTGVAHAAAQVQVLGMQAIRGIEAADAFIKDARQQHQRTGDGVDLLQRTPDIHRHVERRGRGRTQDRREIGIAPPRRRIAHPVVADQVRADQRVALKLARVHAQVRQ